MEKKKERKSPFRGKVAENAEQERKKGNFGYLRLPDGMEVFQEEPKTYLLNFIPYTVDTDKHPDKNIEKEIALVGNYWYRLPILLHQIYSQDGSGTTFVCPRTFGDPCPVCKYRFQRSKEVGRLERDEWDLLKTKQVILYYITQRTQDGWSNVKVWSISPYKFHKLLKEELAEDREYEVFPDFEEGYTVLVRFSKEVYGTSTYAKASKIDFKTQRRLNPEDYEDLLPLEDLPIILPYDKLEEAFFNAASGEISNKGSNTNKVTQEPDDVEFGNQEVSREPKQDKNKTNNRCPYNHTFGKDGGIFDECAICDIFEECEKGV